MFRLGILFESTPPLAKFSKWSPKEVKDSNQSTSNARPANNSWVNEKIISIIKTKITLVAKNNCQHAEKSLV